MDLTLCINEIHLYTSYIRLCADIQKVDLSLNAHRKTTSTPTENLIYT